MVPEPILASGMPKPSNRSATKPTYLLKVEDLYEKENVVYYKSNKLDIYAAHITFSGFELTKKQAEKIRKEPNAVEAEANVNYYIPWQRVISIQNVTYKKVQGK